MGNKLAMATLVGILRMTSLTKGVLHIICVFLEELLASNM